MVAVAQLVELLIVVQAVAGSSPVGRPIHLFCLILYLPSQTAVSKSLENGYTWLGLAL